MLLTLGLSELQMALVVIGSIIIFGILIYNFIRTRGLRKRKQSIIAQESHQSSVGMRLEPGFSEISNIKSEENLEINVIENIEQVIPSQIFLSRIDPAIDCVVLLKFSVPISGLEISQYLLSWPKNTPYRYLVEGLNSLSVSEGGDASWESIEQQSSYDELQIGIQLANRRGPIGVVDLSEFLTKCQNLADSLDAEIDLPPVNQVLANAQELDQFCVLVDIQLGFYLIANMISWGAREVQSALQSQGFILSRDGGSFHFYENDQLIFKVQADDVNFLRDDLQGKRIKQIHFLLDVPLAPKRNEPFVKMLDQAKKLAIDLDGRLLDDNGQALVDSSISSIYDHLQGIYQSMESRDIIPGSLSSLRLFS